MTAFLYRIGVLTHRHPWRVVAAWILLTAAIAIGGFGLGGKLADSFTIPGTESQAALDRLSAVFPQAAGGSAQAVVVTPAGERIDGTSAKQAIADTVAAIKKVHGVESVSSPFSTYSTNAVSGDHRAAIIAVQFTKADSDVTDSTLNGLLATTKIGTAAGLTVDFSGQAFQSVGVGVTITEAIGILFAGVVLVVTFGSLIAAGLPLLSAILGVVIAFAMIRIIALFTPVSTSAPTLALMLGLAVGIDYALFIMSRHREQLAVGMSVEESLPTAVATAGTAVAFAGTTVIIALLGLLVVGIPFLSIMGIGAAFAVFVAVCASVTLLPAILGLLGTRIAPRPGSRAAKRAVEVRGDTARARTMGARWVGLVQRVPALGIVAVVLVLGVLAVPAASLELSLPNNGRQPVGTSERTAYDLVAKHFGAGRNGPLVVLVDVTQNNDFIADLAKVRTRIAALPGVVAVGKATPNEQLDTAIMQVIPKTAPDDPATAKLVERIRALEPTFERDYSFPLSVTGTTAVQIDISNRLGNAFLPFALVVVGLSVILLMMVFRSLIVPIKAAAGFLLSVGASLGVTVAVYQWGWFGGLGTEAGPLLSFLPILVMAILFGLSMDYEVFLVSGMRESWIHGGDARQAVRRGFTHGARVVTAAAFIMLFVFLSFVPEGSATIKPMAFALATGIAFDAFLVRMTLVPAVMTVVGRAAWYVPRWLDRILPSIDIEGEGLVHRRAEAEWAAGQTEWALAADGLEIPGAGPIEVRVAPGEVVGLAVPALARRAAVAVLTGHARPEAGRLQVDGHPSPSRATDVRRIAGPVIDDGADTAATVGTLISERLRLAPRGTKSGSLPDWIDLIDEALLGAGIPASFDRSTPIGALAPVVRLTVLAAAGIAGGSRVVVVDAGDTGAGTEDALIDALRSLGATAVVVTTSHSDPSRQQLADAKEVAFR